MPDYRRAWQDGGTCFFTVNLRQRGANDLLVREIDLLRAAVAWTRARHPFRIHAWAVMPDHMHCVMELPRGETDFPLRWRLIKSRFSRGLPRTEFRNPARLRRGERGIWQRRYWEHLIRDDAGYRACVDYVHLNPVKHGLVQQVADWPYSTFHRWVEHGAYPHDWMGVVAPAPGMPPSRRRAQ